MSAMLRTAFTSGEAKTPSVESAAAALNGEHGLDEKAPSKP
ncbi:hypothetical protein [Paenibacillus sp. TY11]